MLLRYGRTIDNGRLKRAGFTYQYTSAGTVEAFAQGVRLAGAVGDTNPTYEYQRDVEAFFRHSPAVVRRDQS
jgi:UDP-glucose 4-epimerase